MATGPEHYREAERLLAGQPKTAADRERGILGDDPWEPTQMELRTAHVHATLALAAAVALNAPGGMLTADEEAWREAASAYRPDGA